MIGSSARSKAVNPHRRFATSADYAVCRAIHRRHGKTYFFATSFFPEAVRRRTHAVYAFVRTPDDWVDCPGPGPSPQDRLRDYRVEFLRGVDGVRPNSPILRAFCDVLTESGIPVEEPLQFLDAMEQDLVVDRYPTFADLRLYMRGSASAVGVMMLSVMQADPSEPTVRCAKAMAEAMQMTNFLRDIGEDARRGRIYLPLEDMASFDVTEAEVLSGKLTPGFVRLMQFEIERTRTLYRVGDDGIGSLPNRARRSVRLASKLYARILDRIEAQGYDVFKGRVGTTFGEKLAVAAGLLARKA